MVILFLILLKRDTVNTTEETNNQAEETEALISDLISEDTNTHTENLDTDLDVVSIVPIYIYKTKTGDRKEEDWR